EGQLFFDGQEYTKFGRRKMQPLRREMQMIFQDPYSSLNSRKTVGSIISDPFLIHKTVPKGKIKGEVQQLMELVGLNPEHYNRNPKHPYTGALLSAVPIPDPDLAKQKKRIILEGDVPSPIDPPSGCRFHPRCPRAQFPKCREDDPVLTSHHPGQVAACHFPLEDQAVIATAAAPS